MRYGLKDVVFAEPRGRTDAAVMFLGALIFSILLGSARLSRIKENTVLTANAADHGLPIVH